MEQEAGQTKEMGQTGQEGRSSVLTWCVCCFGRFYRCTKYVCKRAATAVGGAVAGAVKVVAKVAARIFGSVYKWKCPR